MSAFNRYSKRMPEAFENLIELWEVWKLKFHISHAKRRCGTEFICRGIRNQYIWCFPCIIRSLKRNIKLYCVWRRYSNERTNEMRLRGERFRIFLSPLTALLLPFCYVKMENFKISENVQVFLFFSSLREWKFVITISLRICWHCSLFKIVVRRNFSTLHSNTRRNTTALENRSKVKVYQLFKNIYSLLSSLSFQNFN